LADKKVAVLRAMSTITHSTDMEQFLRLAELSMPEVLETLKELAEDGYVTKTKHGYAIVEKGKVALTALKQLPKDKAFHFYLGIDQPADIYASSVKAFYRIVETLEAGSLEFHLDRGDFENWLKTAVEDETMATEIAKLKLEGFRGDPLREQILLALRARFGDDVLLQD